MNIFATAIITTNTQLKDILVSNLSLQKIPWELDIYSKKDVDFNIVLVCSSDFKKACDYLNSNYELLKITYIWTWETFCNIDLKLWDIVVPNTLLNTENKAYFLESIVSWNYDLNKFWLMLNWINLTIWDEILEDQIIDLKEESAADIVDKWVFLLAEEVSKIEKIDKLSVILVIWSEMEYLKNSANILELML